MPNPGAMQMRCANALRALVRQCGWAGGLGAVLIVVALVGGTWGDRYAESVRGELAQERARLMRASWVEATAPAESDRSRVDRYYASRFPGASELGARLGRLYAAAQAHGLDFARADYRIAAEPGTPLRRVALALPVQGEFPRIHAWLSEVLVALPELALEGLSIKRTGSEARRIEAELRLVLFVEEGR